VKRETREKRRHYVKLEREVPGKNTIKLEGRNLRGRGGLVVKEEPKGTDQGERDDRGQGSQDFILLGDMTY